MSTIIKAAMYLGSSIRKGTSIGSVRKRSRSVPKNTTPKAFVKQIIASPPMLQEPQ